MKSPMEKGDLKNRLFAGVFKLIVILNIIFMIVFIIPEKCDCKSRM